MELTMVRKSWWYKTDTFLVEVVRDDDDGENKENNNRWYVYAYIYKNHPLFNKFEKDSIQDEFVKGVPFHGYCSYSSWKYDSQGNVKMKQYGADYMHLYDDRFEKYHDEKEAWEVFNDAKELYDFLNKA